MTRVHPYQGLPDYQFWPRAVTWAPPGALDPVVDTRFGVTADDRVATMGSCFAQHLSRHLAASGLTYFVAETGPDDQTEARRRNFGVFSARYGNVYTVAQAVQLFERAFGRRESREPAWPHGDALVDPYRPQVEPDGFENEDALEKDRARHLRATRDVFEQADVFVFTLGLTEAWRRCATGDVFPTAPGVAGGAYDPTEYEFVNFGVDEVRDGLLQLCNLVQSVNPSVRVLLTVSPVPLVATYEDRHVLVSTTYSKAVLRVAAADVMRSLDFVDYFPSYEMISSGAGGKSLYGPDLREVDDAGVRQVMRCFSRHYVDGAKWTSSAVSTPAGFAAGGDVVCDEEAIAAAIERSADAMKGPAASVDALTWSPGVVGFDDERKASRAASASGPRPRRTLRRLLGRARRVIPRTSAGR